MTCRPPAWQLVSFAGSDGRPHAGVLAGGVIAPAQGILGDGGDSVIAILEAWDAALPLLAGAVAAGAVAADGVAAATLRRLAPVLYPGALFCAGANYRDHLAEMATPGGAAGAPVAPAEPWFFLKTTRGSIVGDGAEVTLPAVSQAVDWEAELGVVIARPSRDLSERDALAAVAGYVIVNDLSARDLMKRAGTPEGSPFAYDWVGQKCFDGCAPMGPALTPAVAIADPDNLGIRLWVNGVLKQNSNTAQMVHGIAAQIAWLSRRVTLAPGDVIATGTPAGVGLPRREFLKAGDEVRIEIDGLGILTNRMRAAPGSANDR